MSKFVCLCGNVISDVVYPSPSNGSLISEASLAAFIDYAGSIVAELKHADLQGNRSEWIRSRFNAEYPIDASDAEVVEDALCRRFSDLSMAAVRCEACGRLHLQATPGSTTYVSFARDRTEGVQKPG